MHSSDLKLLVKEANFDGYINRKLRGNPAHLKDVEKVD